MRCPILQKEENESYGEDAKNALDYLNEKPGLTDIKDICLFLLEYADMNDFLRATFGPDCAIEFIPTVDESGKPTIHFIGSHEHLSQIADKIRPYSSTIREDVSGKYYLRAGVKRLGSLLDNEEVAEFLLNEAKESMFWKGHTNLVANQLYKPALLGKLTYLSNQHLESWGLFASPEKLDFYKVFIQECLSITELAMHFTDASNPSALFLADAIANHPCITRINLSLERVTDENLDQLIQVLAKLPALEEVHLSAKGMGRDDFMRTMHAIAQIKNRSLNITVDGLNDNVTMIAEALSTIKLHHYISLPEASHHYNAALAEANFAAHEAFFSAEENKGVKRNKQLIQLVREKKSLIIENDRPASLNNMLIQASHRLNPTQINIYTNKEHIKKLDQRALKELLEHSGIESIILHSNTIMFPFVMNSSCIGTLKKLDLQFLKIKTADDLSQLTQLLHQATQLKTLTLSYVTIKTESPQEFKAFCNELSNHPNLESIILDIKFASEKQEQLFWQSLAKSRSLLGFHNSAYKSVPYEHDLADTCKKNLERQKEWTQTIKGSTQQSMFSPNQKREKAESDIEEDQPVIWI